MIRVVHPGSRIRMLTFSHPGSRGQKSTQSRIRNTARYLWSRTRNRNLSKVGTGTVKVRSTTLVGAVPWRRWWTWFRPCAPACPQWPSDGRRPASASCASSGPTAPGRRCRDLGSENVQCKLVLWIRIHWIRIRIRIQSESKVETPKIEGKKIQQKLL